MLTTTVISARELYHGVRRDLFYSSLDKLQRDAKAVVNYATGGYGYTITLKRDRYWHEPTEKLVRDLTRERLALNRLPPKLTPVIAQVTKALDLREAALPAEAKTAKDLVQPVRQGLSLAQRLSRYRVKKFLGEAARRGLPTTLDLAKAGTQRLSNVGEMKDNGFPVMLLHASGWAQYSNRVGSYPAALSLLCGRDDAGLWAVRVPGTIDNVAAALAWLKPAVVRKAQADGKQILRQGDVWVVERTRDAMATSEMPAGHRWDANSRTLWHDGHHTVSVPFPAIAIRQSTLAGNGNGRVRGD